uniref:Uncharacterized protein n=1 Tax=Nelumbo nucifera TaxID=4432 RepID=A0A822Y8F0_NELNU|nr:TPA_asm: hypothetical protein HUJ06_027336 [Nelumbo nucifera]
MEWDENLHSKTIDAGSRQIGVTLLRNENDKSARQMSKRCSLSPPATASGNLRQWLCLPLPPPPLPLPNFATSAHLVSKHCRFKDLKKRKKNLTISALSCAFRNSMYLYASSSNVAMLIFLSHGISFYRHLVLSPIFFCCCIANVLMCTTTDDRGLRFGACSQATNLRFGNAKFLTIASSV